MNSHANGCSLQESPDTDSDCQMSLSTSQDQSFGQFCESVINLSKADEDVIRIIGQHLNQVGLIHACDSLMKESGCRLNHPMADQFREHVLEGDWVKAENDLNELQKSLDEKLSLTEMKFLILEQKYLELLEEGRPLEALNVLRHDLTPMKHRLDRIHDLSSYVMMINRDELLQKARWPGKGIESRTKLMEELQKYIPPSVMLPPRRLYNLLSQAMEMQVHNCLYHNSSSQNTLEDFDLFIDHFCNDGSKFPCEAVQILNDHSNEVWYCKFSPDGLKLATGSKDCNVLIWDVDPISATVQLKKCLEGQAFGVAYVAWSPDSKYLLVCGPEESSDVYLFNVESDEPRSKISQGPDDSLSWCSWHCTGKKFVTGGMKGQFYLLTPEGHLANDWEGVRVNGLHCMSDGKTILAADTHHQIRAYKFLDLTETTLVRESHPIISFTVSKDEKYALVNVATQSVHLWDLENKVLVRRLKGVRQGNFIIHSSFGGQSDEFAASGSENNNVYIWNVRDENPIGILRGHTKCVNAVSWNPVYPHILASASDDCSVRIWGPSNSDHRSHNTLLPSSLEESSSSMTDHKYCNGRGL